MSEPCWPGGVPATMPAQDRGDIIETYARYAWGLDLADEELLLSAFAEDASFDHLWQGTSTGHAAILESMQELWNDRQAWWFGRQHLFDHYIMEPRQEGARVRWFNAWTAADQVPWRGELRLNAPTRNPSAPADRRPFLEQSRDPW